MELHTHTLTAAYLLLLSSVLLLIESEALHIQGRLSTAKIDPLAPSITFENTAYPNPNKLC